MPNFPWERWESIGINDEASRSRDLCSAQTGYHPETLDELWVGAERYFMLVSISFLDILQIC